MIKNKKKALEGKRIRVGDTVIVIAGNEKGQSGQVLRRFGNNRVIIQGLNVRKKTVRRSEASPKGGMIDREMPIHVSNVMLKVGDNDGVKLRVRSDEQGQRELYYATEGQQQMYRSVKKAK